MLSERSRQALFDIRDNVALAQAFAEGLDEPGLSADRKTFYAITRCLEIISEASRRLADDVKQRHSDQPWERIAGAGNIYRHRYDNVAEAFVWRTVAESQPSLLAACRPSWATASRPSRSSGTVSALDALEPLAKLE